jgi:hypothetical protein
MKVYGRVITYRTLADRRLLKSFGVDKVRVPRSLNPYAVSRRLTKMAKHEGNEVELLQKLVDFTKKVQHPPVHGPGIDMPEPVEPADACAA